MFFSSPGYTHKYTYIYIYNKYIYSVKLYLPYTNTKNCYIFFRFVLL